MKYKDLFEFLGVLLEERDREILGSGMRPDFCRVLIGARKAIILML